MVGWALTNLPTIISLSKQLGERMSRMSGVLSSFMTNTFSILQEIGTLSGAFIRNLVAFDFDDMGKQVDNSLSKVLNSFNRMELDFANALRLLLEPFDFEIEAEEPQQPTIPPGAPVPPGTNLPDPMSAEMYRIAAALSTEGSGKQSVVDMMQVVVNRKAMGYGKSYTAILAGRGQFAGVEKRGTSGFLKIQTLKDAAKWSGQSEASLLGIIKNIQDPSLQTSAAKFVGGATEFRGSPATVRLVNSDSDPNNNIQADATGRIPGSVWRGGNGDNQFLTSNPPGAAPTTIRPGGAAPFNLPAAQTTPSPVQPGQAFKKGDDLTNVIGRGVSNIQVTDVMGSYRPGGRKHGGLDIAAPIGTWIALRLDCEWVGYGYDDYGYGHTLDVWVPELGVQLRFAHLLKQPNAFTKIKAGTSFAQVGSSGRSTAPHIHFEYTKTKNQIAGGSDADPSPYVPYILLTNKPNNAAFSVPGKGTATPAIVSGTNNAANVSNNITPEKEGKTLVVAAPASMYQNPGTMVGSSGGSPILVVGPSLNNLIKQRMLIDLAYT